MYPQIHTYMHVYICISLNAICYSYILLYMYTKTQRLKYKLLRNMDDNELNVGNML